MNATQILRELVLGNAGIFMLDGMMISGEDAQPASGGVDADAVALHGA